MATNERAYTIGTSVIHPQEYEDTQWQQRVENDHTTAVTRECQHVEHRKG